MDAQEIVAKLIEAWNTGDGTRWAAVFHEDAVLVDPVGRLQAGRGMIAEEYQKFFDTIFHGSRLDMRVQCSRPAGEGRVLACLVSTLTVPSGTKTGTHEAIHTTVVRDRLVESFHTTLRIPLKVLAEHDADLAALEPRAWHGHDGSA